MDVERTPGQKQPYEKPVLRTIELVAEEVLAYGCKLGTPKAGYGRPSCMVRPCTGKGS